MAFVAETVVGNGSRGAAGAGLFSTSGKSAIATACLLILDEVMCGMGRTGTLHACEQEGSRPICSPSRKVRAAVPADRCGAAGGEDLRGVRQVPVVQHGHTYLAHPMAAAAALAVQDVIRRDNLLGNVQHQAVPRVAAAEAVQRSTWAIVRGRASLSARTRGRSRVEGALRSRAETARASEARSDGARLMVYPMGGTIDGSQGRPRPARASFIVDEVTIERNRLAPWPSRSACRESASPSLPPRPSIRAAHYHLGAESARLRTRAPGQLTPASIPPLVRPRAFRRRC